ncbi:MAG: ABC transporter permease [Acidobacteriota bacterium]|nr:ABC transporter permease [Acidobacteriota bacterium]
MRWWQRLWRRKELEEQLEKELRFHLDEHAADLARRGRSPQEARRQARLALGGPEQVKEECRDARGTRWLEDLLLDFRYAVRGLRQRPGFAAIALLTLALGTGATTVMFTVVSGVLLKPLPYAQPSRLVALHEETNWSTELGNEWAFAYPNYLDCQRESKTLTLAAWRYDGGTVSGRGSAEYVDGIEISSGFFSLLDIPMYRGHAFTANEARPGGAPGIIISYGIWQRFFGGRPKAIGSPLEFAGRDYTVIGIAPAEFRLDGQEWDVFTSIEQDASAALRNREIHPGIQVLGRLQPGATLGEAQAELAVIGRQLAAQYPKSNVGRSFEVRRLRPNTGGLQSTLWLLLGAVSLVLLIACANVASLLLARAVSRERELAMRAALGASRGRLARQCLTESIVLGLTGGGLGVLLAALGIQPFVLLWPGGLPRAQEVALDWRVLLFALGMSLLSGLLFGLTPALRAPARGLEQRLRAGARTVAGGSRRLHGAFVISEIALATVLLVAAGMLGRTLLRLSSLNPGVNARNVLVTRAALSPAMLADPARIPAAWQEVLDNARLVPGVESAAIVDTVPMREDYNQIGYSTTPAVPPVNQRPLALATCVTPDYLQVMRIPLLEGRFFTGQDRKGAEPVVVIDRVLSERAFGRHDPVGKQLWIPGSDSPFTTGKDAPEPVRVVGVVGHVRYWGLASDDRATLRAQIYYPFAQVADPLLPRWSELMSLAVRTSVAPLSVLKPLRKAIRGDSSDQALYQVRTMQQLSSDSISRQRFLLFLFGAFAGLALLLACVGIYGVLTYLTNQRVPEIGVRMALGAASRDVVWLVLRQSLGMILLGSALGAGAALGASRLLVRFVEGVHPAEPLTLATTVSLLVAAALVASFLPARRASRVDPMIALRQE